MRLLFRKELKRKVPSIFESSNSKLSKFTVGGNKLSGYKADVDTDADYTPDTEVIEDGYFKESTFRSAPYFDIQIDGINLLDTKF